MATSRALVDAFLWVVERIDDPEWRAKAKNGELPKGFRTTMWNLAVEDRKDFFGRFLKDAMVHREKAEAATGEARERELEEAEIERLERRLRGFMSARKRFFCEKCWTELGNELGPVEVTHQKGVPA